MSCSFRTWELTLDFYLMATLSTIHRRPNSLHATPPREEMVRPKPLFCNSFSLYAKLSFSDDKEGVWCVVWAKSSGSEHLCRRSF